MTIVSVPPAVGRQRYGPADPSEGRLVVDEPQHSRSLAVAPSSARGDRSDIHPMRRGGAKSFVDDLVLGRGVVLSRAATSLRSIETQPWTRRFVRAETGDPLLESRAGPGRAGVQGRVPQRAWRPSSGWMEDAGC